VPRAPRPPRRGHRARLPPELRQPLQRAGRRRLAHHPRRQRLPLPPQQTVAQLGCLRAGRARRRCGARIARAGAGLLLKRPAPMRVARPRERTMMPGDNERRGRTRNGRLAFAPVLVLALLAAACGEGGTRGADSRVLVDGSSTVYPLTEAVAEEFGIAQGGAVQVTVGLSGTGGGFQRFCAGETDVNNASRPIKDAERDECIVNDVRFLELPVAYDGLSVVVHPDNTWVDCLTTDELRRIWEPDSPVQSWAQVRDGFPDRPLRLYGPGTDSGTFD